MVFTYALYTKLFNSRCLEQDICDGLIAVDGIFVTLDVLWTVVVSENLWLVDDDITEVICVAVIVGLMADEEDHSNPVKVMYVRM